MQFSRTPLVTPLEYDWKKTSSLLGPTQLSYPTVFLHIITTSIAEELCCSRWGGKIVLLRHGFDVFIHRVCSIGVLNRVRKRLYRSKDEWKRWLLVMTMNHVAFFRSRAPRHSPINLKEIRVRDGCWIDQDRIRVYLLPPVSLLGRERMNLWTIANEFMSYTRPTFLPVEQLLLTLTMGKPVMPRG